MLVLHGPPSAANPYGTPATIDPANAIVVPTGHQVVLGNTAGGVVPGADGWVIFDADGSPVAQVKNMNCSGLCLRNYARLCVW